MIRPGAAWLLALLLLAACDSPKLPPHPFVISQKAKETLEPAQLKTLVETALVLDESIRRGQPEGFFPFLGSYQCVDDLVVPEHLKQILNDTKGLPHAFLFDPQWKARFLTPKNGTWEIKDPKGGLSQGLDPAPVGFREALEAPKLHPVLSAKKIEYPGGSTLIAELTYRFRNHVERTYLELYWDAEAEQWKLTGHGWDCRDW